jgi:hypothetical protein
MSVLFYMLLHLIRSLEPILPSPCTRIFAAVNGTMIELFWVVGIAVLRLGMARESLTLREALVAALC